MSWKNYKFRKRLKNFFVVYFIIALLFFSNYSFSRYIETSNGVGTIEIATPVLTLNNSSTQCEVKDMLPGETRECTFSVSNKDGSQLNEVSMDYYFLLTLESDIDYLNLEFVDDYDDKKIVIDESGKVTDDSMVLNYSQEETKSYTVKIIWNDEQDTDKEYKYEDYNDYRYAGKPITLNIELKGSQIIN